MWGLDLSQEELDALQEIAGRRFQFKNWTGRKLPATLDLESEKPLMAWIPITVWEKLSPRRRLLFSRDSGLQSVLLLTPGYRPESLEAAFEAGAMDLVAQPFKKEKVLSVINRAIEIKHLYSDIYRMTQEIYLERELLARKNEHLTFINQFLAHAAESLDATSILSRAREDLELLLPATLLQAAIWRRSANGGPNGANASGFLDAELYLASGLSETNRQEWTELLLESAQKLAAQPVANYTVASLPRHELVSEHNGPAPGRVMILPLRAAAETFGCLVILAEHEFHLGRDQVEILHSAVKHMGLALKNALLFAEIKNKAQFDGLTTLYNREHFDERLAEELLRHQRYAQPLSLLLLDLDHFKRINDTYGHQTGDQVLREMSKILRETVRATDYVARYGGEEFVIILPHTEEPQAWVLAERLRLKIAKMRFRHENRFFNATSSIGIATLRPGSLNAHQDLVQDADRALYLAKANGRNMVIAAPQDKAAAQG
jgi:diguanylate cyclase (GGDEF)-like protein